MYICFDRYELRKPIIYLSQKNFPDMASLRRYALWITFIFIFIFIWGIFLRGIIKNCYCLELRHLRKRIWRIHFPSDELWRIFDLLLNFNQFYIFWIGNTQYKRFAIFHGSSIFDRPRLKQTIERPVNTSL